MSHRFLIGLDEAGYGPNIGPLVIGASIWQVAQQYDAQQLQFDLSPVFSDRTWSPGDCHIPIGDSKKLYNPAIGLRTLETGVQVMLSTVGCTSQTLADLVDRVCRGTFLPELTTCPWYQFGVQPSLLEQSQEQIDILAARAIGHFERLGVKFLGIHARIIPESEFNRQVQILGSKGQLLSIQTLQLAAELIKQFNMPVEVFCDRQGGRKKYLPLLIELLAPDWFEILGETSAKSSYRSLSIPSRTIHFTVGGDSFPPVSLASMTAKYLRERLMGLINTYWRQHIPNLRATAGYPQDAKRFRSEMELQAARMGFDLSHWWRMC